MKRTIIISDRGGKRENIQDVTAKIAKWLFDHNMGEVGEVVKLGVTGKHFIDEVLSDKYVKELVEISEPYGYKVYGYCNLYSFDPVTKLYPEVRVDRIDYQSIFRYVSISFESRANKGFGINPTATGTLYGNELTDYMNNTKGAIELVKKLNDLWNTKDLIKRLPILITL